MIIKNDLYIWCIVISWFYFLLFSDTSFYNSNRLFQIASIIKKLIPKFQNIATMILLFSLGNKWKNMHDQDLWEYILKISANQVSRSYRCIITQVSLFYGRCFWFSLELPKFRSRKTYKVYFERLVYTMWPLSKEQILLDT